MSHGKAAVVMMEIDGYCEVKSSGWDVIVSAARSLAIFLMAMSTLMAASSPSRDVGVSVLSNEEEDLCVGSLD